MKPYFYSYRLNAALPFQVDLRSSEPFTVPRAPDVHWAIHLALVLEGELEGQFGTQCCRFRAGECYLTGYWEPHGSLRSALGYKILLITVSPEELERSLFTARDRFITLLTLPARTRMELLRPAALQQYILPLLPELLPPETASALVRMEKRWLRINAIFLHLLEHIELPPGAERSRSIFQRLTPALQLLGHHSGTRLSAPEAAAACHLGISRFQHLWASYFGGGFGKFELNYRFSHAVGELLQEHHSIKEVAARWGFSDENHFAKLFKAAYHTAPGRYRRSRESSPIF